MRQTILGLLLCGAVGFMLYGMAALVLTGLFGRGGPSDAKPADAGRAVVWLESVPVGGGQCQVCGTPMTERVVECAGCGTPHHEECWKYTGGCSTYACREMRYVRRVTVVQAGPPLPVQTPDEWLAEEVERDRREHSPSFAESGEGGLRPNSAA